MAPRRATPRPRALALAVVAIAVTALPARPEPPPPAQPSPDRPRDRQPAEPSARPPRASPFDDPRTARAMLARWLEDLDKRRPVLAEAVRMLDAGEPVEKVRDYVRQNSPPFMRLWPGGPVRELDGLDPGDGPAPVTAEETEAIIAILARVDPAAKDRLDEARNAGRQRDVERLLAMARHRLRDLVALRRSDPQMFELKVSELAADRRARTLAAEIVAAERSPGASPADLDAKRKALRKEIDLRHSFRVGVQAMELARIEERVFKIREEINRAAREADRTVDEETEQILARERERQDHPDRRYRRKGPDTPPESGAPPAPADG